jgi:UDP-2-acetamido-3-amino-2,3-dideoxy-glucuronate N-acetyltransferase
LIKKNKRNIGLIGLGYWGKNIFRNLHELKVLHTACDLNKKLLGVRKKEFSQINYTLHCDDIFKNNTIDAVIIATPAATHYSLAVKALKAGKDVFVEKPLALNVEHAKKLVRLAKSKKRVLMVGHILHYHPAINVLKTIIDAGTLGKLQYIYSNRLNIGKLRVEENILWSFAPHDISAILMLVGGEPEKVKCFGETYLNEGVYDLTLTTLEFKNKIKAHIFVSWLHPFKEQRLIVVGAKAMAVFDDLTKEKLFIYPHRIRWKNGKIPVAYKAKHYAVKVDSKEPLKEEMKHFLECIVERRTPKTDGEEAIGVLKVLQRAEASCKR